MKISRMKSAVLCAALATTALAGPVLARKDVHMVAAPYTVEMPGDGATTVSVERWGYFVVAPSTWNALRSSYATNGALTSADIEALVNSGASPTIIVDGSDPDQDILRLRLFNALPVATSVTIPGMGPPEAKRSGQTLPSAHWLLGNGDVAPDDGTGRPSPDARLYSNAALTVPGDFNNYWWYAPLPAGGFIYQSGTHAAAQVQMGLAGPIKTVVTDGEPYPGVVVDQEIDLFLSEIDVDLSGEIAARAATGGLTPRYNDLDAGSDGETMALIDYQPDYFLVNGKPYEPDELSANYVAPIEIAQDSPTLLRFYNAGYLTHTQALTEGEFDIVAEFGQAYPFPRRSYSALMPAGMTKDALWTPGADDVGPVAIYDAMRDGPNPGTGVAGMTTQFVVTPGADTIILTAVDDGPFDGTEDEAVSLLTANLLANDDWNPPGDMPSVVFDPIDQEEVGELVEVDGGWTFTPVGNLNGDVQLSYHLELAGEMSNTATVLVSLAPVNDAPEDVVVEVANKQSGSNGAGGDVWRFYFTDLIGESVDVDGDPLSISQSSFTGLTNGFSLRGTGANERLQINRRNPPAGVTVTVEFEICDDSGACSENSSITVTGVEPEAPAEVIRWDPDAGTN
jgi:FtsP/CotA-like multicopper oxidase with cupredoxin domain